LNFYNKKDNLLIHFSDVGNFIYVADAITMSALPMAPPAAPSASPHHKTSSGPGLYEFLIEAELQHYYSGIKNTLKVGAILFVNQARLMFYVNVPDTKCVPAEVRDRG
jgi:hypothetical protein